MRLWPPAATELDPCSAVHSVHTRLDAGLRAWFASPMKVLSVVLLFVLGLAAPAAAGQYKLENRPEVGSVTVPRLAWRTHHYEVIFSLPV